MGKIFTLSILFNICSFSVIAQSKKDQIATLTYQLDSLKQVIEKEGRITKNKEEKIEGQITDFNKKLLEVQQELTKAKLESVDCKNKKLALEKELALNTNYVLVLKQRLDQLTKDSSQSAPRNSNDFATFIKFFISTVYSGRNFDSLFCFDSPEIKTFINNKVGFGRFYSAGIYCKLYNYEEGGKLYNYEEGEGNGLGYHPIYIENCKKQPNTSKLPFFNNKKPEGGYCEEATSPDGIYCNQVVNLPEDWDVDLNIRIPPPLILKNLNKKRVYIQYKKYVI